MGYPDSYEAARNCFAANKPQFPGVPPSEEWNLYSGLESLTDALQGEIATFRNALAEKLDEFEIRLRRIDGAVAQILRALQR